MMWNYQLCSKKPILTSLAIVDSTVAQNHSNDSETLDLFLHVIILTEKRNFML